MSARDSTPKILRLIRSDQNVYGQVRKAPLPDGEAGTDHTIERMRAAVGRSRTSQMVHQVAAAIAGDQPNRDKPAQLLALDTFLRRTVHFKPDTLGAEVLRDPEQLLHEIGVNGTTGADCDDVATLGASIVQSLGMRPYFVVCAKRPGGPWIHVHYAAQPSSGSRLIPFDPQERVRPGDWTTTEDKRRIYPAFTT